MDEERNIKIEEIDLFELIKLIWSEKKLIFKVTGVFLVLGLVVGFTSKVEFEATCKLLPESAEESADLGGLGGLAGLAGFDLSGFGSSGVLTPELYPEIVKSEPFMNKVINTPVYFERLDTVVSSFEYFKELEQTSLVGFILEYTIGLPGKIKKGFSSGDEVVTPKDYDFVRYTKEDWKIVEKYKERLSVSVDSKTNTLNVKVEMPDPVAAATVTSLLVSELTQRVTDYKIEKAQLNLEFVSERLNEAKLNYKSKQEDLAEFTDRNRNVSNSIVQTEFERLQNELDISFEVYKGLATQLEQAKIKVKEETPVFTVLEPVKIPISKSKPKRLVILLAALFVGLFAVLSKIIVWDYLMSPKRKA